MTSITEAIGNHFNKIQEHVNAIHALEQTAEVEVRFRPFRKQFARSSHKQVISPLEPREYARVREYLEQQGATRLTRKVYIDGTIRKIREGGRTYWQRKERKWNVDIDDYRLRLSVSSESSIRAPEGFNSTLERNIERLALYQHGGGVIIELSRVRQDNNIRYELEIEISSITSWAAFQNVVRDMYKLVHGTAIIYTQPERRKILQHANTLLGGSRRGEGIDPAVFNQPRNLHIRDLRWGGIFGNRHIKYKVTLKTDGQRQLLLVYRGQVWFIWPPYDANLIFRRNDRFRHENAILDGELVPMSKRTLLRPGQDTERLPGPGYDATYLYFVFDCMASQDGVGVPSENVQLLPHTERLIRAQNVVHELRANGGVPINMLGIFTKEFFRLVGQTASDAFSIMRTMKRKEERAPYDTDGLIIMPDEAAYHPQVEVEGQVYFTTELQLHERELTTMPDVCKWKPATEQTIDFAIQWKDDNVTLLSSRGTRLIVFEGTRKAPYRGAVDVDKLQRMYAGNGDILEFKWDGEKMVPLRFRHDKIKPNAIEVAQDNWNLIHSPINWNTLAGYGFELMRNYHNRIKSALYNRALESISRSTSTLLDIGSGRGGDVAKWRSFRKIIAVEPNDSAVDELKKRISQIGRDADIPIIKVRGQETKKICSEVEHFFNGQADVISLMNSINNFWHSEQDKHAIAQTIDTCLKPGGRLILLAPDGDTIRQLWRPVFGGHELEPRIGLGAFPTEPGAYIEYQLGDDQEERFEAFIPDNRYIKQFNEPLFLLDELLALLPGYHIEFWTRAEKELFMPAHAALLSRIYSYGMFVKPLVPVEQVRRDIADIEPVPIPPTQRAPLVVSRPTNKNNPAFGDDVVVDLATWIHPNLVRIACIQENSGFFHALLKAIYPAYRRNAEYGHRTNVVAEFRRDIAVGLGEPDNQGVTLLQELMSPSYWSGGMRPFAPLPPNVTLAALQDSINSSRPIHESIYQIVADLLDVDVYLIQDDDLIRTSYHSIEQQLARGITEPRSLARYSIVMLLIDNSFELIGQRDSNGLIAVVFPPWHDLILHIRELTGDLFLKYAQQDATYPPGNSISLQTYIAQLKDYLRKEYVISTEP